MMNEQDIEQEIQEKGLTARRITPERVDAVIVNEDYHVFPNSQLTVCCLTLVNGFTVTGESACASPENFDVELGRQIARDDARDKIWALEGYLLKQKLHEGDEGDEVTAERNKLLTLAMKHCPREHHDWQEILRIAGDARGR